MSNFYFLFSQQTNRFKFHLATLFLVMLGLSLKSQDLHNEKLIAASQADAAAVYFKFPDPEKLPFDRRKFKNQKEFTIRNGLPNFIKKTRSAKPVRVAYLGGSITRSETMYRLQSAAYLRGIFRSTDFEGINAGISGSDADLGACRFEEQVLRYKPDLLFIEFAVNGAFAKGVEGIIRQARKSDPSLDICLIYTVTSAQLQELAAGYTPAGILALDSVAVHYGLPSIHLAQEAAEMLSSRALVARGVPDKALANQVFSQDGVHPLPFGGDLYAAAIARSFQKMKKTRPFKSVALPEPFHSDNWEDAKMLDPLQAATFSDGWVKTDPESAGLERYKEWFPYLMRSGKAGESLSFRFKGSMFGIFDIGGPEAGMLELLVNGKRVNLKRLATNRFLAMPGKGEDLNRFNAFSNNRYRGQFICIELEEGYHTVSMKISSTIPDKRAILGPNQLQDINANPGRYNQSVINLGKILIRGEIAK